MTDVITDDDKLKCAVRELKMRNRVYPRWIDKGEMSSGKAAHEIACMEAIVSDYEQRLSGAAVPGKAAPVSQAPQTPAGAATNPVPERWHVEIEDQGREMAMRGRQKFLEWYALCTDDERKRLQAIAGEIKDLYPS